MDRNKSSHPLDASLLAYLDGELSESDKTLIQRHLEQCWPCRVRIGQIEESIAAFIALRQEAVELPPVDIAFRKFKRRVEEAHRDAQSSLTSLRWIWEQGLRWLARNRASVGAAMALIALLAIVRSPSELRILERPPHAREVLRQALAVQRRASAASVPDGSIIHRLFRIEARTAGDHGSVPIGTLEVWQASDRSSYARYLRDARGQIIAAEWFRPGHVRASYLNPSRSLDLHLPLSLFAQTPAEYLQRLAARREELALEIRKLSDGSRGYEIRGRAPGEFQGDSIEASVLVASNDFRILEEAFIIASRQQLKAYTLTAVMSEALRARSVDPTVFEPDRLLRADLSTNRQEIVRRASGAATGAKLPGLELKISIDPNLAVRVHHALHKAKACMGEEVELVPHPELPGKALLRIVVDSEGRKHRLVEELAELESYSEVKLELRTRAELAAADPSAAPAREHTATGPEFRVKSGKILLHETLYEYFSRQVRRELSQANSQFLHDVIEARVNRFASKMLRLSQDLLLHAWALKRLAEAFPEEQRQRLSASAASRLEAMFRDHAYAIEVGANKLRSDLQLVVWPEAEQSLQKLTGSKIMENGSEQKTWSSISQHLFALAVESNAAVQFHFAARAEEAGADAAPGERLLASLFAAELLAGQIGKPN